MSDTKMLQIIIDGQKEIRQEIGGMEKEMRKGFTGVNKRIDKIGSQLAYLEDDAPTREENEALDKRVSKLETQIASV